jgi:hypothetical protein
MAYSESSDESDEDHEYETKLRCEITIETRLHIQKIIDTVPTMIAFQKNIIMAAQQKFDAVMKPVNDLKDALRQLESAPARLEELKRMKLYNPQTHERILKNLRESLTSALSRRKFMQRYSICMWHRI